MQKVDNTRRKIRQKLVAIEKKVAYWQRREKRDEGLRRLVTKDGQEGLTRLEHFENLAAELRRGAVPRALDRSWQHQWPHL